MGTSESLFSWPGESADDTANALPPVALIAGATASGKSGLAVTLAKRWEATGRPCVIINADSAQVYSDLAILSARPDDADMQGIPHKLFGYIDGYLACSAARWARDARQEIDKAHELNHMPILVGGTGLYIRTLLDGIAPIPEIDPLIRQQVRVTPVEQAYEALLSADPAAAARLGPSDITRIARALEVVRSTGRSIMEWRGEITGGIGGAIDLRALVLLPPRDWLYERCDQRFAAMLDNGGIAEVERLLQRKLAPDLPVMRAIGVPQIVDLIGGQANREDTLAAGQLATRQYAKRQYTWFRNQSSIGWQRAASVIDDKMIDEIEIKLLK